jgi:hypothetical protein
MELNTIEDFPDSTSSTQNTESYTGDDLLDYPEPETLGEPNLISQTIEMAQWTTDAVGAIIIITSRYLLLVFMVIIIFGYFQKDYSISKKAGKILLIIFAVFIACLLLHGFFYLILAYI